MWGAFVTALELKLISCYDLAKDEHLDPINVKIAELREALEKVTSEQQFLKAHDTRHRHTNESTRKRVIFYTVLEYVMLVLASGVQIHINKSITFQHEEMVRKTTAFDKMKDEAEKCVA